ncbi:hypothetical protein BJ166DRAFT_331121 [Pestalotiopsis sp. NC0098]|nr:hypothetical protein BJ166DRAFT_331121 [Pestalotiopsis sp. NC0098]
MSTASLCFLDPPQSVGKGPSLPDLQGPGVGEKKQTCQTTFSQGRETCDRCTSYSTKHRPALAHTGLDFAPSSHELVACADAMAPLPSPCGGCGPPSGSITNFSDRTIDLTGTPYASRTFDCLPTIHASYPQCARKLVLHTYYCGGPTMTRHSRNPVADRRHTCRNHEDDKYDFLRQAVLRLLMTLCQTRSRSPSELLFRQS